MYEDESAALSELASRARDELVRAAEALRGHAERFSSGVAAYDQAWSRSNLAGHASMYYDGLLSPPPERSWSVLHGLMHGPQHGWTPRTTEEVVRDIGRRSGTTIEALLGEADDLLRATRRLRDEAVALASAVPPDARRAAGMEARLAALEAVKATVPSAEFLLQQQVADQVVTQDLAAAAAPRQAGPHQNVSLSCQQAQIIASRATELAELISRLAASAKSLARSSTLHAGASSPSAPVERAPASQGATGRLEHAVQAIAVAVLFALFAGGFIWLFAQCDAEITPKSGRFEEWVLGRAGSAAGGTVMVVLTAGVCWYGLVQRRREFLSIVLGMPLRSAAALASGAALLTIFGIG